MTMRIIQGFSAGQAFVARGRSLTDREVSQELLDGLAKLFGAALSPGGRDRAHPGRCAHARR